MEKCDICGRPGAAIIDGEHVICETCFAHMNTCALCDAARTCDFQTNPSPIPKTIRKEIRQGNMVAVTDIQNPERVEITCKKNCGCFSAKLGCLRQFNTCGNVTFTYRK